MKCPVCGKAELISCVRDLPYTYKGHETHIQAVDGDHCAVCDEFLTDPAESERVSNEMLAFNRQINSLAGLPIKVARARKKLGLTQHQAGLIFGGGVNAFSRYERGLATPSVALVKLLEVLVRHPELLAEVQDSKIADA